MDAGKNKLANDFHSTAGGEGIASKQRLETGGGFVIAVSLEEIVRSQLLGTGVVVDGHRVEEVDELGDLLFFVDVATEVEEERLNALGIEKRAWEGRH